MPTPTAPVKIAKVDRSMPTLVSATTKASEISVIFSSLPNSTCARGVRSATRVMRSSNSRDATVAAQSRTASAMMPLMRVSAERRRLPSVIAALSRTAASGARSWRMFRAASDHAAIAISRARARDGTRSATSRMTSHARSRLAATRATSCGQDSRWATLTATHRPEAHRAGVISGTSSASTNSR